MTLLTDIEESPCGGDFSRNDVAWQRRRRFDKRYTGI
jgi:hypothetical protein